MLPLIQKSLECGVPKLQLLSLEQIGKLFKSLDYQTFKTALMPRVLQVLESTPQMDVKIKILTTIKQLQEGIDESTMKHNIFKTLEKVRSKETDPEILMLVLRIYEKSSDVLGADEIGLKILPGIIPMLVSGNLSKTQFNEIMQITRQLLDKIEKCKLPSLTDKVEETKDEFKFSDGQKIVTVKEQPSDPFLASPGNELDFLSQVASQPMTTMTPI